MTRNASASGSCEARQAGFLIRRSGSICCPDNSRMLLRPFLPEGDHRGSGDRAANSAALSERAWRCGLREVKQRFTDPLAGIDAIFANRCRQLRHLLPSGQRAIAVTVSADRRLLHERIQLAIGGTVQPLDCPAPGSGRVPPGSLRFIMSLRATGEGHLSSIEFRSGLVSADGDIAFDPVSGSVTMPEIRYPRHRKADFVRSLVELGFDEASSRPPRWVRWRRSSIPRSWRSSSVIRSIGHAGPA